MNANHQLSNGISSDLRFIPEIVGQRFLDGFSQILCQDIFSRRVDTLSCNTILGLGEPNGSFCYTLTELIGNDRILQVRHQVIVTHACPEVTRFVIDKHTEIARLDFVGLVWMWLYHFKFKTDETDQ